MLRLHRLHAWQAVAGIIIVSMVLTGFEIPIPTWPSTAAISLVCGVGALSLMASSAILASRWSWIERIFGGLDRVYRVHKWLGVYALVLASIHLLFKADMRGWDTAAIFAVSPDWARLARQASFVGLMLTLVLALNRNIPYGVWRWWHRLSGPIFLIVVVHWLSIKSPLSLTSPIGLWLATVSGLAVVAATWKLTLYPFLARHSEYRVVDVVRTGTAAQVELLPTGRHGVFKPGQFGFLRMKAQGLREPHPFTIAAGGGPDGRIRFVIRSLGDFTEKLIAGVAVGMRADVYAPHGAFQRNTTADRELWIAGGVGISPFIAWMEDQAAGGFDKVTLFYFYTPGRAFPDLEVLRALADDRGVEFVPISTGPGSAAFNGWMSDIALEVDPSTLDVAVCGPAGLLEAVVALMKDNGLPAECVRSELFTFR